MVHPNMGTTLTYLTTDLAITSNMLRQVLKEVCDVTFNRVSIDGEMSTNDSLIILANGLADNEIIDWECWDLDLFREALLDICTRFARMIAKDGEGAKHLVTCTVQGASTEEEAVALAKSVIQSTLTKTAVFANDANWGRIMVPWDIPIFLLIRNTCESISYRNPAKSRYAETAWAWISMKNTPRKFWEKMKSKFASPLTTETLPPPAGAAISPTTTSN